MIRSWSLEYILKQYGLNSLVGLQNKVDSQADPRNKAVTNIATPKKYEHL